jgi:hypothetical protein
MSAADVKAAGQPDSPVKPPQEPARAWWVLPATAAGLLLAVTGVALAVALPITMRSNPSRGFQRLEMEDKTPQGIDRTYFVAADVVDWDYAPSGRDLCKGKPFGEAERLYVSDGAGRTYKKALFREYTDRSFKVREGRVGWERGEGEICG